MTGDCLAAGGIDLDDLEAERGTDPQGIPTQGYATRVQCFGVELMQSRFLHELEKGFTSKVFAVLRYEILHRFRSLQKKPIVDASKKTVALEAVFTTLSDV